MGKANNTQASGKLKLALTTSAFALLVGVSDPAVAQDAAPAQPPAAATAQSPRPVESNDAGGVQEIVVTAQKRAQRLQDVPVAVTALSSETLQANRVTNVTDLSGLAPGFTARPASGGIGIASFAMRGVLSFGVVPGSDKEVSLYLDGVYVSSTRASIFELPDIERVEVLRGPQGTLFGRNSTAGAVSIVTRDPTGQFHVRQEVTLGNYDQFRTRTTVDLPAVGPFSAYGTYVHDERRGDIRNLGAGTVWDRTGPQTGVGVQTSPKYLGNKNAESFFGALKFAPSDSFSMVYKYDNSTNHYTPNGQGVTGLNPDAPLIGPLLSALAASSPNDVGDLTANSRPKAVNNAFTTAGFQKNYGHSLTTKWNATDHLTVSNIAAYRYAYVYASQQLDGLGGLVLTPQAIAPYATLVAFSTVPGLASAPAATQAATIGAVAQQLTPLIGSRFIGVATNNVAVSKQWSDETQVNYNSTLVTLTGGGIWFHSKDRAGGPLGIQNTFSFTPLPADGTVPLGNANVSYNKATSIAAYLQAELHVTPKLDVVGGARVTHDKKSGTFDSSGTFVPAASGDRADGTFVGGTSLAFTYHKTKPSFSVGLNYKPDRDILVYGKYSTGFVSGGSVGGVAFSPETVKSEEAGLKAEWLGRRLQTNLALFNADYNDIQGANSGVNVGRPDLSTVILDSGDLKAYGAELEITAAPATGLTLNGSVGYTHAKFSNVPQIVLDGSLGAYEPFLIPKVTANLSAAYKTQPVIGDANLSFRVDANWRDKTRSDPNPNINTLIPVFANSEFIKANWVVNGRVELQKLKFGPVDGSIALWGRNIFDSKVPLFRQSFTSFLRSTTYQPARTYGIDLIAQF